MIICKKYGYSHYWQSTEDEHFLHLSTVQISETIIAYKTITPAVVDSKLIYVIDLEAEPVISPYIILIP